MKFLLDTHTLLWAFSKPDFLSYQVRQHIETAEDRSLLVSSISIWEISKLLQKRKFTLNEPLSQWVQSVRNHSQINMVDMDADIALESCALPGDFHSDPADQIIVATARIHHATILTKDHKILAYPYVKATW
jgi:PIN domain nuclease of toxin-antitoxin system